jgi:hypothetical protein
MFKGIFRLNKRRSTARKLCQLVKGFTVEHIILKDDEFFSSLTQISWSEAILFSLNLHKRKVNSPRNCKLGAFGLSSTFSKAKTVTPFILSWIV